MEVLCLLWQDLDYYGSAASGIGLGMGIHLVAFSQSDAEEDNRTRIILSPIYFTLSVASNTIATLLIIWKIVNTGRRLDVILSIAHPSEGKRLSGSKWSPSRVRRSVGRYTGILAILIESSLPLAVLGIAAAIVNAQNSSSSPITQALFMGASVLSPQLIIFRVMTGRVWKRTTESTLLEIATYHPPAEGIHTSK